MYEITKFNNTYTTYSITICSFGRRNVVLMGCTDDVRTATVGRRAGRHGNGREKTKRKRCNTYRYAARTRKACERLVRKRRGEIAICAFPRLPPPRGGAVGSGRHADAGSNQRVWAVGVWVVDLYTRTQARRTYTQPPVVVILCRTRTIRERTSIASSARVSREQHVISSSSRRHRGG